MSEVRRPTRDRPSTLTDVAEVVGVSPRTVSRVVNDEGGFSEDTRRRVLDAVERLAYRPNVHARRLLSGTSGSIGFVAPVLSDPFFPELAEGVQRAAQRAGLTVLLAMSDHDEETQCEVLTSLEGQYLDALVVFPIGDLGRLVPFLDRGMKMVVVDTVVEHANAISVLADLEGGTRRAVEHLVARGCRSLAMISDGDEPTDRRRRRDTFAEAVPADLECHIVDVAPTLEGGRAAAERVVAEIPTVDGVFAYNDVMAIGAVQRLQALGRRVPDDIAVVGCDDVAIASVLTPALTTIRIDRNELGAEAVRLVGALGDGTAPTAPVRLPVELVVRDSA